MATCIIEGCEGTAEKHHALRNRYPFNKKPKGSTDENLWRNHPDLVQHLCREHHFDALHQRFARSDNWPAGWGFADTPLLRGKGVVEAMLSKLPARSAGTSRDSMPADRRRAGGYANLVLYRMCGEQPQHDDVGVVEAKLRLIGDHYRASLKRGIGKHHLHGGDGFFIELARAIRSSDLDERLDVIRRNGRVDACSLDDVVDTHAAFEDLVVDFTREWQGPQAVRRVLNRRSFCSKYLHFHAPEAFFIYDSVVLGRFGLRSGASYRDFAETVLRYAVSGHDRDWTPRSVDMEVYGYEATPKD